MVKTKKWWKECLQNPEKLENWLVRLCNNEKDAEFRFIEFANKYCRKDSESYLTFIQIASEEKVHAALVGNILHSRGIKFYEKSSKDGKYWRNALPCAVDKVTASAIGAYAETLSLSRMRIIISDPNTPVDLKSLFVRIEPDEARHVKLLRGVAGKYGMKSVVDCHNAGLEELGLRMQK